MRKLFVISFLLLAACASMNNGLGDLIIAQKYVPGTEDLPVYNGFQPIDAKNIVYDSASGRIIDASYFRRDIGVEEVRGYYTETLPQLGWRKKKSSEYTRDGESLKVNVTEKKGVVLLKFVIRPVG